jgi:hypothetical protein
MSIQSLLVEDEPSGESEGTSPDSKRSGGSPPTRFFYAGMHTPPISRPGSEIGYRMRDSSITTILTESLDYIGRGSHDPFSVMAVTLTPRMREHLYYCEYFVLINRFVVNTLPAISHQRMFFIVAVDLIIERYITTADNKPSCSCQRTCSSSLSNTRKQ